ncbi:MAG: hypothetical protein LBM98_07230 [Oscillospiraceae bacterium]|jgi:hypothetical protein|nr:hypothetical protein [Oscillospiraceae bacterium]
MKKSELIKSIVFPVIFGLGFSLVVVWLSRREFSLDTVLSMAVGVPLFPAIYNINKYRRLAKDPAKYEDEQAAATDERGKAIALAADSALLKLIQIPAVILVFVAYIVNTRTLMIVGVTVGTLVIVIWLGRYALRAYFRRKM